MRARTLRIFPLLLVVVVVSALFVTARPVIADPIVSIQPPSSVVDPGQNFSVNVFISGVVC